MSSELGNGTTSKKMSLTVAYHEKEKYVCWAEQVGVDTPPPPPRVKDPIHSWLDMIIGGERP